MKILIVDDEPLIHVSIEYTIRTLGLPGLTVYNAANGREMLAKMQEAPVDLALVDIRMPGMNGLEAIQAAKPHWPDTDYYIMSGYSEFEYAKEAVRLQVAEYLLKPLPPEQLASVIRKVQEKQALRSYQIRSQLTAWLDSCEVGHRSDALYPEGYYAVAMLATADPPGGPRAQEWLAQTVGAGPEHFFALPREGGALGFVYATTAQFCLEALQKLPAVGCAPCTLFVSSPCCTSAQLQQAVDSLLSRRALRVFHGVGRRYNLAALGRASWQELQEAAAWQAVYNSVCAKDHAAYAARCAALLKVCRFPLEAARCRAVEEFFRTTAPGWPDLPADRDALAAALARFGEALGRRSRPADKLDALLAYVQQNFDQDISLATLSDQFDLTPNYLSSLLKKRLGVRFTDYLIRLRLERAKELLRTTQRPVRQVAEAVGYYSLSYFTKLFIDKVGCSPAEYRNRPQADTTH